MINNSGFSLAPENEGRFSGQGIFKKLYQEGREFLQRKKVGTLTIVDLLQLSINY